MINRCNMCENCKKLARIQKSVLACCGTPNKSNHNRGDNLNHADDGVVQVWNDAVKDFPCTGVLAQPLNEMSYTERHDRWSQQ